MRIVFAGAVDFSRHCLGELFRQNCDVVGVFNPERQDARMNSDYADLAPLATAHGVPVYRIRKINSPESVDLVRSLDPDILLVFGFSQLISTEILKVPPLGCIGTHPALLPRDRGRHPLIWALVDGLGESGLTFFYLDEGADSGDILWQRPFPITTNDDAGTLYARVKELASEGIRELLPQLESGTAPRYRQDPARATYRRKRTEADGEIDWSGSALTVYNLIRALTRPYPGARTFAGDRRLVVWRSRLPSLFPSSRPGLPGEVLHTTHDGLLVQSGDGVVELLEWECSGALKVGTRLGRVAL